jgi:hypothetical protein
MAVSPVVVVPVVSCVAAPDLVRGAGQLPTVMSTPSWVTSATLLAWSCVVSSRVPS